MAEVTVDIAGRSYRLGCGEGEEQHLAGLAAMLDTEARGLLRQFGQMSDTRLMLMTSLVIADKLTEAEEQAHESSQRLAKAEKIAGNRGQATDLFGAEREEKLTRRINNLVDQIESLAGNPGT